MMLHKNRCVTAMCEIMRDHYAGDVISETDAINVRGTLSFFLIYLK